MSASTEKKSPQLRFSEQVILSTKLSEWLEVEGEGDERMCRYIDPEVRNDSDAAKAVEKLINREVTHKQVHDFRHENFGRIRPPRRPEPKSSVLRDHSVRVLEEKFDKHVERVAFSFGEIQRTISDLVERVSDMERDNRKLRDEMVKMIANFGHTTDALQRDINALKLAQNPNFKVVHDNTKTG